jgi:hypothetical protein
MRYLIFAAIFALTTLLAAPAIADHGHRYGNDYYVSYGGKVDRHLDRKGDVIQHRFEHKAIRAEAKGKYHKADRMRVKGERINHHLDRKGDRIHAYYDNRYNHQRSYSNGHKHYTVKPRVVYRTSVPHNTYFGLVFNQPGLSIGWGWYD